MGHNSQSPPRALQLPSIGWWQIVVLAALCGAMTLAPAVAQVVYKPKKAPVAPAKKAPAPAAKKAPAPAAKSAPAAAKTPPPAAPPIDHTKYFEIDVLTAAEKKAIKPKQFIFKRIVENKMPLKDPENTELFDTYTQKYFLPKLTQIQYLPYVPELHDELMKPFRAAARANNQAATERLNNHVFTLMSAVARGTVRVVDAKGRGVDVIRIGERPNVHYLLPNLKEVPADRVVDEVASLKNFHHSVRYNAMYLIGRLNEKAEVRHGNTVTAPAQPLLRALQPLIDAAGDGSLPDYVRIAAQIGIARHLHEGKLAAGSQQLIVDTMLKIVAQRQATAGNSAAGNVWKRRLAVDILKDCGLDGPDQIVSKTLSNLVGDTSEPLSLRLAAAQALGSVQRDNVKAEAVVDLATQLAGLALDVAEFELSPDPEKQPLFSRARAADGLGAVLESLGGKPALVPLGNPNEQVKPAKLSGAYALVGQNEQPFIKGLIDRVGSLRSACADETVAEPALRNVLDTGSRELDAYAKAGPEAALAAPEGPTVPSVGPINQAPMPKPTNDPFDLTPKAPQK